jgi:hypothetical protein
MFANGYAILKWAKARQRKASGWSPLLPKSPAIIIGGNNLQGTGWSGAWGGFQPSYIEQIFLIK